MLASEDNWRAVKLYAEKVMIKKEEAERAREMVKATLVGRLNNSDDEQH